MTMLILSFFSWWYSSGWKQVFDNFMPRIRNVANSFSVSQLLRTLFAPWRRIISYPGASLNDKMRAWGDNLFSRIIGFIVRLGVLLTAFLTLAVVGLLTAAELIIWPLLPLAVVGCLIAGLVT